MKLIFKSGEIIKIPGKETFDELSLKEIGLMIEADSSISPDGNEYFSSGALDSFMYDSSISRTELKDIQEAILANIYIDIDNSNDKKINKEYLLSLSKKLSEKG